MRAALSIESGAITLAAIAMAWAVAVFFVIFLAFTVSAIAFKWPPLMAELLDIHHDGLLNYPDNPSFNCITNRGKTEQAICNDKMLSIKDKQLAGFYEPLIQRLAGDKGKLDALIKEEHQWLEITRNNCGDEAVCIDRVVPDKRIGELQALLAQQ